MKIPIVNILWRHCADCGCTIRSPERNVCSSCHSIRESEVKVPEIQEFSDPDITDAYDEVLPEMENDIRWGGRWTE